MNQKHHKYARILAIDPTTKGFAYAVLESNGRLIGWGKAEVPGRSHRRFLERVDRLFGKHDPRWLAVEDCLESMRHDRAHLLINKMLDLAHFLNVRRSVISRDELRSVFGLAISATKYQIAEELARRYPELRPYLPDPRKLGDAENDWMNVFDAVAFASATQYYEYGRHSEAA